MVVVSTFQRAQPEISTWPSPLRRAQRGSIAECHLDGWRLCPMDASPAELLASDAAATSSDIMERLRDRICQPISVLAR